MIHYKTKQEIELMRISSQLVSKTLAHVAAQIKEGISTMELNNIAEEFIKIMVQPLLLKGMVILHFLMPVV